MANGCIDFSRRAYLYLLRQITSGGAESGSVANSSFNKDGLRAEWFERRPRNKHGLYSVFDTQLGYTDVMPLGKELTTLAFGSVDQMDSWWGINGEGGGGDVAETPGPLAKINPMEYVHHYKKSMFTTMLNLQLINILSRRRRNANAKQNM